MFPEPHRFILRTAAADARGRTPTRRTAVRTEPRRRGRATPRRLGLTALVVAVGIGVAACVPQPPPPPPPAPAQLSITPGSKVFVDDAPRGGGQNEVFVVKNVGGQTSGALGPAEIVGAGEFVAFSGTCDDGDGRLAPGETCEIEVLFSADSGGAVAVAPSKVQISATPGGTATADLAGTEMDSTPIGVSYSETAFADANTPGGVTNTYIVNNGSSFPVTGVFARLDNAFGFGTFDLDASNCAGGIALSAACLVFVTYTNDRGDGTTAAAKLVIGASFADQTSIDLTGVATGTPNVLSIDAGTGNIDDSFLDATSSGPLVLTITNGGLSPTGPLSAIFNGSSGEGQFGGEDDTCTGTVLAPGASCTYGVSYKAVSPVAGTVTIQVTGTPGGFASTVVTGTPTG
jgi:hypothetical protein